MRFIKIIKNILRTYRNRIRSIIEKYKLDFNTHLYLKKAVSRKHNNEQIKVGFLVFEPESWDKIQPVYEEMVADDRFHPEIIVVPSFDVSFSVGTTYGYELDFFESMYDGVIRAYDNDSNLIDLRSRSYDYVFYQDPYNGHYPLGIQSFDLLKFTKICYIPYGYTTLKNFEDLVTENIEFFRNVYAYFPDTDSNGRIIEGIFKKNIKQKLQYVLHFGFPSLEKYLDMGSEKEGDYITWAPRWSYDPKFGGSHFLEYKDLFVDLNLDYKLLIRPHPMLFTNLIKTGLMTENDVKSFINLAELRNIEISEREPIDEVIKKTKILITDISSIIPAFFLTGKPLIYCNSGLEPNEEFAEMLQGIYIANDWSQVNSYLDNILNRNDYLQENRKKIIEEYSRIHRGSTVRILDWLAEQK